MSDCQSSDKEQAALRRRQCLEEILASTCKHLHTPEACEWCILEILNAEPPGQEVSRELIP